jgi:hypothetical protein
VVRRTAAGYDCIQPGPGGLAFRCNGMLLPDLQGRGTYVPLYLPRNADN